MAVTRLRAALSILLAALALSPAALGTGSPYPIEEDGGPCAGNGGIAGPPTTGIDTDTWEWFDEYTCNDGSKVRVGRGPVNAPKPNAGYVPDPPSDPPPGCVEGFYTDEDWEQGTC